MMTEAWLPSEELWRNKCVVVTGGRGFVGQNVVRRLRERGAADVYAVSSRDYDLRRLEDIRRLLDRTQPQIVIHLAAHVGGIGANRAQPAEFLYDNLIMGVQLLHESYLHRVEKFVTLGTVCSYPKFTPVPFREEELWNGYPEETNAPYGLAKKMLLAQSQAYRQQYGFNAIYLLCANLYGPGDSMHPENGHVIPMLIRKCLEAQQRGDSQIVCWGDGSPTREFLYVEDAAQGIVLATERYNDGQPVNLGSAQEISIKELVAMITHLIGFDGQVVWDGSKPNGQPRRKLDTSRAAREFAFRATTPFPEGLRRTIEWARSIWLPADGERVALAHVAD